MLYIMLAFLMLFAALFNSVCLYNAFLAIEFFKCFFFHALSWVIDAYFVHFKYYLASCTVLLICWFSKFHVNTVFYETGMCSLEK